MKTRKILTLVACAVLLVAISVAGTIAFLNDQSETVTNTFSVGNITITLDEENVDGKDGEGVENEEVARDIANSYKLIPGTTYDKDPIVHVTKDSEVCWVFITVDNEIADIELQGDEDHPTIAEQIEDNGWTEYDDGVYYKKDVDPGTATGDTLDLPVFTTFTIDSTIESKTLAAYKGTTVVINAYAIQSENLDTVEAAWAALNPAPAPETH